MRVRSDRLPHQLAGTLAPVYMLHGDEPLLIEEAADQIRRAAAAQGYSDRVVLTGERGFDWGSLTESTRTLSLFAERRLVELRLPTGRPGDRGAKALSMFATAPPEHTLLLVIAGKLDANVRKAKWFAALDRAGVAVSAAPLGVRELPGWIAQRLRSRDLDADADTVALLAHYFEGNLMAAAQEIDKLALMCSDGRVARADIEAGLMDHARFDAFGFVDTCLQGKAPAAVRALAALRAEGVAPVFVVWALGREVRLLAQLAAATAAGQPRAQALKAMGVWASRAPGVSAALARFGAQTWGGFVRAVARLDRIAKGRAKGDIWFELERLGLRLCGTPLV